MDYQFNHSRSPITCCRDCKPPKRYPGCGDHCDEYKKQKAKYEADKAAYEKKKKPPITQFDFNVNCQHDPRKREKRIIRN